MGKFFRLVFCICLLVSFSFSFCFADTVTDSAIEAPDDIVTVTDTSNGVTLIVNDSSLGGRVQALEDTIASLDTSSDLSQATYDDMRLMSVNVSNESITSSDANGFKAVVLGLLGDYETVVTDYTYSNGSYTSHSIEITPDWSWLAGAGIFAIVLFCFFRLVGGILCNR